MASTSYWVSPSPEMERPVSGHKVGHALGNSYPNGKPQEPSWVFAPTRRNGSSEIFTNCNLTQGEALHVIPPTSRQMIIHPSKIWDLCEISSSCMTSHPPLPVPKSASWFGWVVWTCKAGGFPFMLPATPKPLRLVLLFVYHIHSPGLRTLKRSVSETKRMGSDGKYSLKHCFLDCLRFSFGFPLVGGLDL